MSVIRLDAHISSGPTQDGGGGGIISSLKGEGMAWIFTFTIFYLNKVVYKVVIIVYKW